jgi:hypothetical protein
MAEISRRTKPKVTMVGTVERVGTQVLIAKWGLGLCLRGCRCHLHPITRGLSMLEGANGSLGLHKYHVCYCCEPWTWQELDGFVKDLAAIAAMTTIEGLLS